MLNNLKAISLGFITIILFGLLNQLIFIMASVGYNALLKSFSGLLPYKQLFVYVSGIICFFIVMASAGYIAAMSSKKHPYINTSIAAFSGMSFSLYFSLQQEVFTLFALLFIMLGLLFSLYGCYRWVNHLGKTQKIEQ